MVDSTLTLLERAQAGDAEALDALIARFLPRLQRWATGRLPGWARDLADTHDLVQETVVQAFKKIEKFEVRGEGRRIVDSSVPMSLLADHPNVQFNYFRG